MGGIIGLYFGVGEAQFIAVNAHLPEGEIFGDRKFLRVPSTQN